MKTTTYISLLRGINVSGQKKILMEDLKNLYEQLDFENVTTYIQSGNVIFNAGDLYNEGELAGTIEKAITGKFGFYVPVIVRNRMEMQQILANNPFLQDSDIDRDKLYVTFLNGDPRRTDVEAIEKLDFLPDRFAILGKEAFIFCASGYGRTKISNSYFENRLKVPATTRNWKTVIKLSEMASFN